MYRSPCKSVPVWMCILSWGHQETRNQPTARYATHVLHDEPPRARFNGANPKSKKGNCPAVGLGPSSAGGQMTGPNIMAGAATSTVTANTFIQGFITDVLLSPDVVTSWRPSLVSLRDFLSGSLAQEGLVQIAFLLSRRLQSFAV